MSLFLDGDSTPPRLMGRVITEKDDISKTKLHEGWVEDYHGGGFPSHRPKAPAPGLIHERRSTLFQEEPCCSALELSLPSEATRNSIWRRAKRVFPKKRNQPRKETNGFITPLCEKKFLDAKRLSPHSYQVHGLTLHWVAASGRLRKAWTRPGFAPTCGHNPDMRTRRTGQRYY